jgi:4-hydroxy-4-methyl-2-oxoglutarate aldolase
MSANWVEIRERLVLVGTTAMCDANRSLRVVDGTVRPRVPGLKLAGPAYTVSCRDDFLTVLLAIREAAPGDVLVVDGQNGSRALAGEFFVTEAKRRGLAGIVVDGAVRDITTIGTAGLPVYSRTISPMAGSATRLAQAQVSVTCGGARIIPGDIVFGDDDGLVVGTVDEFAAALTVAEQTEHTEAGVRHRLRLGHDLFDMLNFDDHLAALREGRQTQLRFLDPNPEDEGRTHPKVDT